MCPKNRVYDETLTKLCLQPSLQQLTGSRPLPTRGDKSLAEVLQLKLAVSFPKGSM